VANSALVSIIIPTFNRADCVSRTIASALAQTHANVEVLVIDDGSTDATRAVVLDTFSKDPRVRYVHKPNGGVSSARNHGIRLVQGEYAALLDSDDVWKPFKLELQLACLDAFPDAGMVWSDMTAVTPQGEVLSKHYLHTFYSNYSMFSREDLFDRSVPLTEIAPGLAAEVGDRRALAGEIYGPMILGNLVHTSTVLLRRERLAATGFFDETRRSGEDHEFHLRTCRAGRVAFVDVDTIDYQVGRADALTQPKYGLDLAMNYLNTLTSTLERDRDRIKLPQHVIDKVLADGHAWVAETLVAQGRHEEARPYLLYSLRHTPAQPRLVGMYTTSFLPARVMKGLVGAYQKIKKSVR
jgi:glycosyltransferase involved in cell wall biosynthesis